ncbi:terminal uridylyltransferase 4 isoform X1 [Rhincodon typus]|uniref:terminal uridylyltransferase 4 isoform X1 n=1 Tax=Rhincodon typus TaxID=259920 RepID=UPI00202DFFF2|nr:terminal uridylyltransferase 4 isoform X1 [Rhincodon typus]XP_048457637.1 terminal uridylyltransferase 4 isoform X1 [Rhincodon typus]
MEEAKNIKDEAHKTGKSPRLVCGEGKDLKVTVQNDIEQKPSKNLIEGSSRDSSKTTSNWNNKKSKWNEELIERKNNEKTADVKLGRNSKQDMLNCIASSRNSGARNIRDQGHSQGSRASSGIISVEKIKHKQVKTQQQALGKFVISHTSSGIKTVNEKDCLPVKPKESMKLVPAAQPSRSSVHTNSDDRTKPGKSMQDVKEIEKNPEASGKTTATNANRANPFEKNYPESVPVIDESKMTAEQQLGLKQAEERLERDYISRLEKRSSEYPSCQYLCKLCLVHIENIQGAHKHIKEKRHKKNIAEKQEENELRNLIPPTPDHLAALNSAVLQAAQQEGISEQEFQIRKNIVNEMEKIIQQHLPDCSLRLYGSCLTRFAFKTSDINIDVKFPSHLNQPDVLIQVLDIIKNTSLYSDVESDFHAKVPIISCRDIQSGLICKVSAGNDVACLTTNLLAALAKLEPRLIPLVLAFRCWARVCHIDCQAEGGIPSYSFTLMVIFFLQQRQEPLLPAYLGSWIEGFDLKRIDEYHLKGIQNDEYVLWEHRPANSGETKNISNGDGKTLNKAEHRKSSNKKMESTEPHNQSSLLKEKQGKAALKFGSTHHVSLGHLWLELLKFYTLEFALEEYVICIRVKDLVTRENKNWPKRRIAIEDPFALKRNIARSLNSQMVFEYILERFRTAYKYFASPQMKDGIKLKPDARKKGKVNNKKPLKSEERSGNCCLPQKGTVIGSDIKESSLEGERTNGTSDSGTMECTNTTVDSTSNVNIDAEHSELKSVPSSNSGIAVNFKKCSLGKPEVGSCARDSSERLLSCDSVKQSTRTLALSDSSANCSKQAGLEELDRESMENMMLPASLQLHGHKDSCRLGVHCSEGTNCTASCVSTTSLTCTTETEAPSCAVIDDTGNGSATGELHYVFEKSILTNGKPPTIVCSICKRDGHSKNDCPEDFKKIDLKPLPPMINKFKQILDLVCTKCYDELSPLEEQNREQTLASLERFIRKEFDDKARLCLFGSSKNGFGFRDSDLDICMTLEGHETAEKLNCKEIIEGLAKVLKKHPGLRNILPITTAKVPIVKFEHRQSGLEGDISLYNTLAQHNTRMLATYAAIDPRVKYLGYTMKVFAKRCDIGDASRGSLSSYAYVLMVLYFLQQRKPPVIPVLQEIFDGKEAPQRMVDGWNAFFFDDVEELKKKLPELGTNKESVGELWLGLLRFYTEEFDFKEYVICIRQKKLLTTFEKQWTSKCIAIEDPFDLNHNLGAGVSRKMTNFIMKAFINGRRLFGTPVYPLPGMETDYFFDSKILTDGELAPNDRCCRICGKIGHYMKDCPKRRRMKKKENDKDEEKDSKEEEKELREKRCFICGDTGHMRRDCPEYRTARPRNNTVPVPQATRNITNGQAVTTSQASASHSGPHPDFPQRNRQPSECSEPHQTPPYSPQTVHQQLTPNSSQTASVSHPQTQQAASQNKLAQTLAQPTHQVQMSMFPYAQPHPGQYSSVHSLGLIQSHQPQHQVQMPTNSWPPLLHSASGNHPNITFPMRSSSNTANPNNMNLNDPSIIFAQPAARPMGLSNTPHDGQWHNHMTRSTLVGNGPLGASDQRFQGQFAKLNPPPIPWEHHPLPHFQAPWPYRMPQNFIQQGNTNYPQQNKSYYSQGPTIHSNQHFPIMQQGRIRMNYIQQKK